MSVALHLFQLFKGNLKTKTKMFLIWNNLLSGFEEFLYLVFSFYLVSDAFLWPSFLKKLKNWSLVFFGPDIQHIFLRIISWFFFFYCRHSSKQVLTRLVQKVWSFDKKVFFNMASFFPFVMAAPDKQLSYTINLLLCYN